MRKNNYYSPRSVKSSTNEPAANKDLLIRRTTKNSVAPFRSSKDSRKGSTSPMNSESSSQSPQPTFSESMLSNFPDNDSQNSTDSFSSTKRDLFSKDEFNSMLEFDELNLPKIESSRKSVALSTTSSAAAAEGDELFQTYISMSQISHISELSRSQIQAAMNRTRLSNVGNSLYELSVHLRTITDVRAQVLYFRDNAPLKYLSYSYVSDLLLTSLSCPPDMPYFILTMAAKMVLSGNVAPSYDLKFYIKATELLMSNPETFFVSFHADQDKPQRNLRKMLAIFQGKLADLSDDFSTSSQIEYFAVDPNKRTPNYHPNIEIDERVTLRFEAFPDIYTKEEQKSPCFIEELNKDIPPKIGSPLIRFLSSTDNLLERRRRGHEVYRRLSPKETSQILKLVSLFTSWDVAYDASLSVWQVMLHSEKFDIEALLSQLPVSYGDFLVEAVKTFAKVAGISIGKVHNIR